MKLFSLLFVSVPFSIHAYKLTAFSSFSCTGDLLYETTFEAGECTILSNFYSAKFPSTGTIKLFSSLDCTDTSVTPSELEKGEDGCFTDNDRVLYKAVIYTP
ncbi:hypothetical protein BB559_001292 [Furculomyces boomerangus]|uniref:Uncharacterized protein n=1 Tax=Furculomyces boomerangus TaxID=61424 RepID=A0A2T9Z2H6_9FUNG|nr:hypothetical protein BB559_001292 [Furculomyces boomerangus]